MGRPKDSGPWQEQLETLFAQADTLGLHGKHHKAIKVLKQGWKLIPEDKRNGREAMWVLAGMGDESFMLEHFDEAREYFEQALATETGPGDAFTQLRLGQICYEKEDYHGACQYFKRALEIDGDEIFDEEDPEYKTFYDENKDRYLE